MSLYKTINFSPSTRLLVWKISESFEQLHREVTLTEKNTLRLQGMKSELHQRGFLSVRKLLQQAGYTDTDLYYDEFGKPHLNDDNYISITHSHHFSAIIISKETVGIDIERCREKITVIAEKFANYEMDFLSKNPLQDYIRKLTVIWGAKEAVFKIRNEKGISFNDHIKVIPFEMNQKTTTAWLQMDKVNAHFELHFEEIEDFILVYAFEKK